MNTAHNYVIVTALLLAGFVASTQAAVSSYELTSSYDLKTLTADSKTYAASRLINVTLTDVDDSSIQLIYFRDTALTSDRSSVIEDLSINTGIANLMSGEFMFNAPVVNRPGIDFVLFDFGGQNEAFSITLNSVTQGYSTLDTTVITGLLIEAYSTTDPVTTVAELEAVSFPANTDSSASLTGAIGIDLDDFGLATGASATSFLFTSTNVDPLLIVGLPAVPSPSALPAGLLLLAAFVVRRR
ncbi:hypothetical protein HED60_06055 [Planctomycetales bacterium ZRK34]|nr:hypothetical protein HED60_06055 [Planctomycetales bacterium ZRK34]